MTEKDQEQKSVDDSNKKEDASKTDDSDAAKKALESAVAASKDALIRAYAEMENMRKRFVKEKEDCIKFSSSKFAKDMLTVVDNFERALSNFDSKEISDQVRVFYDGIVITHKDLVSALAKNGISKIEAKKSDNFDHNFHQIMREVEDDTVEGGQIVDIYQTGYMIHDRLLRPTLVSVAKKK